MKKVLIAAFLTLGLAGCQTTAGTYYTPVYGSSVSNYSHPRLYHASPRYYSSPHHMYRSPVCTTYSRYNPYVGTTVTRRVCR